MPSDFFIDIRIVLLLMWTMVSFCAVQRADSTRSLTFELEEGSKHLTPWNSCLPMVGPTYAWPERQEDA